MTTRLASAALAAAMVCGWMSADIGIAKAAALSFEIDVRALNSDGKYYTVKYSNGNYTYHAEIDEHNSDLSFNVRLIDGNNYIPFNYKVNRLNPDDPEDYSIEIKGYGNVPFSYIYEDAGGNLLDQGSYGTETNIDALFYIYDGKVEYSYYSDSNIPNPEDIDISFKNTLTTVSLPASAPMFGAALLGLAGFGYAAKRKKAAAAA